MEHIANKYAPDWDAETTHDEEFKPTFVGSAVFLYTIVSQNCIFWFNYGGKPYMQSLRENSKLLKLLIVPIVAAFIFAMDPADEVLEYFSITYEGVPDEARYALMGSFVGILGCTAIVETVLKTMKYQKFYNFV